MFYNENKCRVLVLGGARFVGYNIVHKLLRNGYDVTVLNRGSKGRVFGDKVTYINCDRTNENMMKEYLQNVEFEYAVDVSGMNRNHAEIAFNSLCKRVLKKYIFLSSSAVYLHNINPIKEKSALGLNKTWEKYGADKIEAEEVFLSKNKEEQFPVIVLRPPYIYGERNNIYREAFIFDRLLNHKVIVVPGRGETRIQFIHIEDLCNIIHIMLTEHVSGECINVGNEGYTTFLEWIKVCETAAGTKAEKVFFHYSNSDFCCRDFFPFHDYEYYLDVEKMQKFYRCKISLTEGLKRGFAYYRQYGGIDHKKAHYEININKIMESHCYERNEY